MATEPRPVGPLLDELGVTLELADADRITGAVVLVKTVDLENGDEPPALVIGADENQDWIGQAGLLAAAQQVMNHAGPVPRDDEDA